MVEKAGHGKNMAVLRKHWIEEGKPKASVENDEDEPIFGQSVPQPNGGNEAEPTRLAPVFEMATEAAAARNRKRTPARDDDPFASDEDIYNATPRRPAAAAAKSVAVDDDVPDDLDALMAEAEAEAQKPARSLFGSSLFGPKQPSGNVPDDDDLEALMAEAEAQEPEGSNGKPKPAGPTKTSIFGGDSVGKGGTMTDDGDDLDALIAEAEDAEVAAKPPPAVMAQQSASQDKPETTIGTKDEEAMAEMEGLW
jgi:replication fork protection complex subunit Csm3/Swi3